VSDAICPGCALADEPLAHIDAVRRWSSAVWTGWSQHHDAIAAFVAEHAA
jgi:hypothetical protein